MTLLERRRAMMKGNGTSIPTISFPEVGTPWSSIIATVPPNHAYIGSQNWNVAYYNFRDGTRSDPPKTFSVKWFTLPAGAVCQLIIRDLSGKPGATRNINISIYLADSAGDTIATIYTNSQKVADLPKSFIKEFTVTEATDIYNIYVRGYSAAKEFSLDVELTVNGDRWL